MVAHSLEVVLQPWLGPPLKLPPLLLPLLQLLVINALLLPPPRLLLLLLFRCAGEPWQVTQ